MYNRLPATRLSNLESWRSPWSTISQGGATYLVLGVFAALGTFVVPADAQETRRLQQAASESAERITMGTDSPATDTDGKFIHLFYFKFKDDVDEAEIEGLLKELAAASKNIPGVRQFLIGKNEARQAHGFQYGEIVVFDKKEDLEVFERHPDHLKLVRKIGPKMVHGVTMDFTPLKDASFSKVDDSEGESPKKMFIHAFSFKFRPAAPQEKLEQLMIKLAATKSRIPVLKEFVVGKNVARNSHGFQYGEIAVFDSKKALQTYQHHPEHSKLVPQILTHMEIGIAMDFEPFDD